MDDEVGNTSQVDHRVGNVSEVVSSLGEEKISSTQFEDGGWNSDTSEEDLSEGESANQVGTRGCSFRFLRNTSLLGLVPFDLGDDVK